MVFAQLVTISHRRYHSMHYTKVVSHTLAIVKYPRISSGIPKYIQSEVPIIHQQGVVEVSKINKVLFLCANVH